MVLLFCSGQRGSLLSINIQDTLFNWMSRLGHCTSIGSDTRTQHKSATVTLTSRLTGGLHSPNFFMVI